MECPLCGGAGKVEDPRFEGERWRSLRLAASLTAKELARRIGWTDSYIVDLELGRRRWTEKKRKRFMGALKNDT